MEISWCSASAVRFIGTQRPSATIDHEVSTHSATAARVRCSVSTISTSVTSRRRSSPPARRSWALSSVRGTLQASVSPNAHGRVAPVASPAAPERCVSRSPRRLPIRSTTSRSADSPSRRSAFGDSRSDPSGARSNRPACCSSRSRSASARASTRASSPSCCPERVQVDVLEPGSGIALRELLGQRVELPELLQRPGGLAHAQRVVAAEPPAAVPVLAGAQTLQLGVQLGHGLGQPRVAERLLGQLHQLGPLLGAHRVEHPLRGRRPLREQVDELLGVARVLREELAVLGHELVELRGGVLPGGVVREQLVEVVEHLADPLDVLRRRVLHRLLHAGEALVEHLPAEQVADLLVRLAGLAGLPVVGAQLAHRAAGVGGQRVQLHLPEPGVVGVPAAQLVPLGVEGTLQQLADLLQRAVEPVLPLQPAALLPDLPGQLVQSAPLPEAAAQQLLQRRARGRALHHVAADLVQRRPQVERWGERVRAVDVGPVPHPPISPAHPIHATPRISRS